MSPSTLGSENLKCLTEKFGTIGLQVPRKNRSGSAKKRARKARLAEAPTWDSDSGQTRSSQGDRPQILQKPSISGAHGKTKGRTEHGRGLRSAGPTSLECKRHTQAPGKRQRPSGGTHESGQAKRPKQAGQISYPRAVREGIRVAVLRTTRGFKSPERTLQTSSGQSSGLCMGSLNRSYPQGGRLILG